MKLRAYFHICMALAAFIFELVLIIRLFNGKYKKYRKNVFNEKFSKEKMERVGFILYIVCFLFILLLAIPLIQSSVLDAGYVISDDYPIFSGTVVKKEGANNSTVYIHNDKTDITILTDIYNAKVNVNDKIVIRYLPHMEIGELIQKK